MAVTPQGPPPTDSPPEPSSFDVPCPDCAVALVPNGVERYVCPVCGDSYRGSLAYRFGDQVASAEGVNGRPPERRRRTSIAP